MAEAGVARALRAGAGDGDHAAAVLISNTVNSASGSRIFKHFVGSLADSIASGAAQAKGMVLVASGASPETYNFGRLKPSCFQVLDCVSDPLGWGLLSKKVDRFHDIRDLNALFSTVSSAGKALLGNSQGRFAVAIDSLSMLLRHHSLAAVLSFISQLRALESVSVVMWFTNSVQQRVVDSLQYLATVSAFVEPQPEFLCDDECETGRLRVRQKRRSGLIRKELDEFKVEYNSLKFYPIQLEPSKDAGSIHQVQFRLELSEMELEDRSKVVLPFEHQGNGKEADIYDGRKDKEAEIYDGVKQSSETGSIHYLRDSDDEFPDSDEDPDDDLDI